MPVRIYAHLSWTTFARLPLIHERMATFLCRFLLEEAMRHGARTIEIGVVPDHVHLLLQLPAAFDVPRLVQGLKGASARVANRDGIAGHSPLRWASGYDLRSVGLKQLRDVADYVRTQERRHGVPALQGARSGRAGASAHGFLRDQASDLIGMSHPRNGFGITPSGRWLTVNHHATEAPMIPRAEINVTPTIDVMLVLLIIFMIVTPAINTRVRLPQSDHAEARPEEPGEIILGIDRSGAYSLFTTGDAVPSERGTPDAVTREALGERLAALYKHRVQDRILYLKADSALAFGPVEEAIEIARRCGVRVVAAVTERRARPGVNGS